MRYRAQPKAVETVYKTFGGKEEHGGTDGWLVYFDNTEDTENARRLINMLPGWQAVPHPNVSDMIKISGATTY